MKNSTMAILLFVSNPKCFVEVGALQVYCNQVRGEAKFAHSSGIMRSKWRGVDVTWYIGEIENIDTFDDCT